MRPINIIIILILAIVALAAIASLQKGNIPAGNETTVSLAEGQRDGPLLVQKIYPDRIEGLSFIEYPLAIGNGTTVTLHIGETASNGCNVMLTLIKIDRNKAIFSKKIEQNKPCPICLSENTYIDTPQGRVSVKDMKEGMAVWTVDNSGVKMRATVLKTGKTEVNSGHEMIHLLLSDGRELFASPGHPLADRRLLGSISTGDIIDGAKVISAQKIPYKGKYTYDILPSGDTGLYFADGILVKSTIS
jgi:hypothetical protein